MRQLMADYRQYVQRVESRGEKLICFKCPDCHQSIKTLPAPDGEVWDTISTCPHCERSFIKITHGKNVEAEKL